LFLSILFVHEKIVKIRGGGKKQRTEQEIKNEIQAIIRQITASVTFLPVLEDECMLLFFTF
jgi:hypothetical protein